MIVPVIERFKDNSYCVYVKGEFVAVVFFVLDLRRYYCVDIRDGSIFSGSTSVQAVEIYFKNCFKECLCNE